MCGCIYVIFLLDFPLDNSVETTCGVYHQGSEYRDDDCSEDWMSPVVELVLS